MSGSISYSAGALELTMVIVVLMIFGAGCTTSTYGISPLSGKVIMFETPNRSGKSDCREIGRQFTELSSNKTRGC